MSSPEHLEVAELEELAEAAEGNERKFRKNAALMLAAFAVMLVMAGTSGMLKVFQRNGEVGERFLFSRSLYVKGSHPGHECSWFYYPCYGYGPGWGSGWGYGYGYGGYPYYGYYGKGKGKWRNRNLESDQFLLRHKADLIATNEKNEA